MMVTLVACGGESKESSKKKDSKKVVEEKKDSKDEEDYENLSDEEKLEKQEENYIPLNKDEVNEFNKKMVPKFRQFFKDNGFEAVESEKHLEEDTVEGIRNIQYEKPDDAVEPCYGGIYYGASAYPNVAYVGYDFYYFIDEKNPPKAEDLLIAEPYKILTGDDISDETMAKINEIFTDAFESGIETNDELVEINGPFEVLVSTTTTKINFSIVSDGDGN